MKKENDFCPILLTNILDNSLIQIIGVLRITQSEIEGKNKEAWSNESIKHCLLYLIKTVKMSKIKQKGSFILSIELIY